MRPSSKNHPHGPQFRVDSRWHLVAVRAGEPLKAPKGIPSTDRGTGLELERGSRRACRRGALLGSPHGSTAAHTWISPGPRQDEPAAPSLTGETLEPATVHQHPARRAACLRANGAFRWKPLTKAAFSN